MAPGTLGKAREGMEVFPFVTENLKELVDISDILIVATTDESIGKIAHSLANENDLTGKTLVHTSGLHSSKELEYGDNYNVLSLHPLLALADWRLAIEVLPRAYYFYEGNEYGQEVGRKIIQALGAKGSVIPGEGKALYHASAVIFSNFLVSLLHLGERVQLEAVISKEDGLATFWPLIEGTLVNVKELGTLNALTGPILRGDKETITRHLEALTILPEDVQKTYRALASYNLELAKLKGLSEAKYTALKETLMEGRQ